MDNEKIMKLAKELEKMGDENGYLNLEIAFLINGMNSEGLENITEEQINKVKDFVNGVDEIVDEYVKDSVYEILNEEV